jgi:hypothetical protein
MLSTWIIFAGAWLGVAAITSAVTGNTIDLMLDRPFTMMVVAALIAGTLIRFLIARQHGEAR